MAKKVKEPKAPKPEKIPTAAPFDFVRWLTTEKKKWEDLSPQDQKAFNPFIVNRFLSMDLTLTEAINELQQWTLGMDKDKLWRLYYELLPKGRLEGKYIKSTPIEGLSERDLDILKTYFSSANQQIEIKNDTMRVFWWEPASQQNPIEFRDTSIIAIRQIAMVNLIKGRNALGERGIGIQISPFNPTDLEIIASNENIDAKQLSQINAASIQQKLQGQAAGVQIGNDNSPGGGSMVRIHGIGSINANSPLYVVDGVPLQGNINSINPNDVESVQVLKDPSQTAMYGVRGANGVILIKTLQHKENAIKLPPLTLLPLTIWSWGSKSKLMHKKREEELIKDWLMKK